MAAACILEGLEQAGLDLCPHGAQKPEDTGERPLEARIHACRKCPLGNERQNAVPGEGSLQAQVMFLGEAPGAEEDRQGRPFVGPSGQLLDKILEGGMGLRRDQVYIANILKCRPPGNRDPYPAEIELCTPYLEEQIALIQPRLLIALGRFAAQHLLSTDLSLGKLRGQIHQRPQGGPPVLVTYHPAYLLRNPAEKRACWEDIQLGLRHLEMPIPGS
ncbi:MAG: uracil-DNA glycosylase [Planctomycetota bacterium]